MNEKIVKAFEDIVKGLEDKYLSKDETMLLVRLRDRSERRFDGMKDYEDDDCSWEEVYFNQRCEV